MEEEINAGPEIKNTEKVNTKFGFLNWLGIAWAFYWRTYLLTVVLAVLFLVLLKYTFFLLSAFMPASPTLPVVFDVLKWFLAGLACYFASSITVRWIITLKNRIFLLQLTNKAGQEVPVLEARRSIWFKLGWSFFWRQLILTVLLGVAILGVFILFNYLSTSLPPGLKAIIRFVLQMLTIFIAVLSVLINIKWFLKSKHKYYDLKLLKNNHSSALKRNIGLICFVIFSVIYAYSMTCSPWKKFLLPIRLNQQFANVQPVSKKNTTFNNLSYDAKKEFVVKFFDIVETKKKWTPKLAELAEKILLKNNKNAKMEKRIFKVISKLEALNTKMEMLKVPVGFEPMGKLKKRYCIVYKENLELIRGMIKAKDLKKYCTEILPELNRLQKMANQTIEEMLNILHKKAIKK